MARGELPITVIGRDGVAPPAEVTAVPADDHQFSNDGRTFLLARNNGASPQNVTIPSGRSVDGSAFSKVIAVPNAQSRYIGPFGAFYNQTGNKVHVDVTSADLRLSVFRVPRPG